MADEQAAGASQAEAPAQSQADGGTATSQADTPDLATLEEQLRKTRRENQSLRKRLGERKEDDGKQQAESQLSEAEKLKKQLADSLAERERLDATLRQERTARIAERLAQDSRAVYPDLIARLIAPDLEFEPGEDEPANAKELLTQYRRRYPLLFRAVSGDGGAQGAVGMGQTMNDLIRQAAGRR